ncbi:hypothetical protein NDU88_002305 [Pleurodeles waltl]|uniref:Uncharacterized protein n=1 Tax=Pleurodeles waltl TaxID=8319 RepID=A0AAV7T1X6_PLEWA|nr:hypothetical protein NDU88_002305 [Pleurodeles waltl]
MRLARTGTDGKTKAAAPALGRAIVGSGGGDLEDADSQQGREDEWRRSENTQGREEDEQAELERVRGRWLESGKWTSRRGPVSSPDATATNPGETKRSFPTRFWISVALPGVCGRWSKRSGRGQREKK